MKDISRMLKKYLEVALETWSNCTSNDLNIHQTKRAKPAMAIFVKIERVTEKSVQQMLCYKTVII